MKTNCAGLTSVCWLVAPALLILTGCAQTVWVRPRATEVDSQAAVERCLSAAYLQAPPVPTVASAGSGVASPSFTTCSGPGVSGRCVTARGVYTRPLLVGFDANARARTQAFRQCMYAGGWSEQTRSASAMAEAPETDWTRGFDVGVAQGADGQCIAPPSGIANRDDWLLGCRSGQKAR